MVVYKDIEQKREYHRNYYHSHKHDVIKDRKREKNGRLLKEIDLSKEHAEIINLYVEENLSTYKIAKRYNVDKSIINKILRQHNVVIRNNKITHLMTAGSKNTRWTGYEKITGAYWSSVVYGATKARSLSFNITIMQAWELFLKQNGKCAMTGIDLSFAKLNKDWSTGKQTASLDRIDSSKGYEIDNIWWVHKRINMMKKEMSVEEFQNWCILVANHKKDNING